ncbi:MAG: hypothetical protein MK084_08735 [Prochlorococcus sp. ALOHA_A2.0_50]|nr:hypothetical protein [Prochlorococcus sp. ALOHA_A2.0_50]
MGELVRIYVRPVLSKYENSVTKMTSKNSVDEQFIEDLGENCTSPLIWQTTANIIQKYIKQLVIHEVDVITDSDWFHEKLIDAIQDSKKLTPKK